MQNRLMKKATVYSSLALALAFTMSGCGGGGGALPAGLTLKTVVKVQDGNILGLLVTDNTGQIAAAVVGTPGAYAFGVRAVLTLPLHVRSQNSAAIVTACSDTNPLTLCDPVAVISYQDLDNNGAFSTGDVLYNGGMDLNYVPPTAGNIIYVNPLSALISAAGVAPAVAGLTAAQVLSSANGDITLAAANVQSVAAQLLAIQEALINTGADRAAIATFIQSIAANATGGSLAADIVAALTLPGGTPANTLYTGASVPTQANLIAAANNIATAITAAMAGAAAGSTNYEAIIAITNTAVPANATLSATYIAQLAAGANSSGTPLTSAISASDFDIQSGVIQTAVNNVIAGTAAVVTPLFIMPVYNDNPLDPLFKTIAPQSTLLNGFTNFSLTYNAANSITINGVDAPAVPGVAGQTLPFDAVNQMYGLKVANLFVSINLNFSGAKVLSVCNDYAGNPLAVPLCTLHHYALPTQAEVCGFQFSATVAPVAAGTFFADQTVGLAFVTGHADYGVAGTFTTMNAQASTCP